MVLTVGLDCYSVTMSLYLNLRHTESFAMHFEREPRTTRLCLRVEYTVAWVTFGLITYALKFMKYKENWKQKGNRVFFVGVLIAAIVLGPTGLLVTHNR